ncbi:WD40 repeat domain-containing protein [Kitasatospora camelliae]|uniref:WD40 repeat domain-containing protein n=1 Tax=Kitasatospora camelliae TaxID=3156397 RepID=A0AAU8JNT4_9ACTN
MSEEVQHRRPNAVHPADPAWTDPEWLVTADPQQVHALLDTATDPGARTVAAVYRAALKAHPELAPEQRRQVLALTAARYGETALADRIRQAAVPGRPAPAWHPAWATGPATADPRLLRTLTGHAGPVIAVATATAGGRPLAVSAGRDATVRAWDLVTGGQLHVWEGSRTDPVSATTVELLALATATVDGRAHALTTDAEGTVRAWDLETGRPAGEFARNVQGVTVGRPALLTVDADGALSVWDPAARTLLGRHPAVLDIGVLDGRTVAATAARDGRVQVADLATGRLIGADHRILRAGRDTAGRAVAATRHPDGTVQVWDLDSGLPLPDADPDGIARTPGESLQDATVLTVAEGRAVAVTLADEEDPVLVGDLSGDRGGPTLWGPRTALLGTRRVAVLVRPDHMLDLWDLTPAGRRPDGTPELRSVPPGPPSADLGLADAGLADLGFEEGARPRLWETVAAGRRTGALTAGRRGGTGPAAASRPFTLDGRPALLAAGPDGTLTARTAEDGPALAELPAGHTDRVWAVDTLDAPDHPPLAVSTGLDRTVRVWDLTTHRPLGAPLAGHAGQVWDATLTTLDGRPTAVTAGADHTVRLWDLAGPHPAEGPRPGHTGDILALTTARIDGRDVAITAGADHTLRTWDLATGRPADDPVPADAAALTTTALKGRPVLVLATPDATLRTLDPATGHDLYDPVPTGHGRVLALAAALVDDRPVVVTAGSDRTVRRWDPATGEALGDALTGHTSRVTAVATLQLAGRPVAATGSWDKTVRLWDLTTGQPLGEPLTGHTDWVTTLAASTTADGAPVLISTARDRTLRRWDPATGRQLATLPLAHPATTTALTTPHPDHPPVTALTHGRTLTLTGPHPDEAHLFPHPIHALTPTPDGTLLVATGPELALLHPRGA